MTTSNSTDPAPEATDLRGSVRQVIQAMARIDPGRLHPDMQLEADLGYDSLRLMELAFALEQRFGLPPIDLGQAVTAGTVGQVTDLVVEIRAGGPYGEGTS